MQRSNIEWLNHPTLGPGMTWNPLAMRCSPVSSGCEHCWHLRMADRHAANLVLGDEDGPVRCAYRGDGPPVIRRREISAPLRRRRPTLIAVQLMGDLFHEHVTDEQIAAVFGVMSRSHRRHTFAVLTKRPARMLEWVNWVETRVPEDGLDIALTASQVMRDAMVSAGVDVTLGESIPFFYRTHFPSVWLGVSVEDQATADERIPILLQVPAARWWVSVEPLLGPTIIYDYSIACRRCDDEGRTAGRVTTSAACTCGRSALSWVVAGAETGPGARPMDLDWARSLRDQCRASGVPFFFKRDSDGSRELDGRRWEEWPGGER